MIRQSATLRTMLLESERSPQYEAYTDYAEPVRRIPPHRVLAINRGEREEALKVVLELDEDRLVAVLEAYVLGDRRRGATGRGASPADEHLLAAVRDAFKRLIAPSIEREIRAELTEKAEEQALAVFRENLRSLLLQAPLRGHVVIGLDPAFRTGVKVAVVDPTGRLLATDVIYPTAPHHRTDEAARKLTHLVEKHGVTAVAIGNGTASRETESFVASWLKKLPAERRPAYAIIDEAGASVYSASAAGQREFPDLDVSERSAVSIARRLQESFGGVGQNRAPLFGRWAISARRRHETAGGTTRRRRRSQRQPGGCGPQHSVGAIVIIRVRFDHSSGGKHRGQAGSPRALYESTGALVRGAAGAADVSTMCRIFANSRGTASSGSHADSPRIGTM